MPPADVSITVTDSDLFKALGDFLQGLFTGADIYQSQQNSTPMPLGNFITMTGLDVTGLSTVRSEYRYTPGDDYGERQLRRVEEWVCQVDFYGPPAQNQASIFSRVCRSEYACEWFRQNGTVLIPLYAGDPRQTSMINGEMQYEPRWTVDFHANPVSAVVVPQQFMTGANVRADSVDSRFPPEKK
jgi:hypothetical protein